MSGKVLSLYFHIPVCFSKCNYCQFYSIPQGKFNSEKYISALKKEWDLKLKYFEGFSPKTIYFGGGTPSLLGSENISIILEMIKGQFPDLNSKEITLEANPESLNRKNLEEFLKIGINRLSIGVQSFNDRLLGLLGRRHSAVLNREKILLANKIGFKNISIDLMYDIPTQTVKDWNETLDEALSLSITHVSMYNLTIEKKTEFYKRKDFIQKLMPNQETSRQMYELAIDRLEKSGFGQYEISAFALPGYQSEHNKGYWTGRPFLGFGPSAFSYFGCCRFKNVSDLNKYCKLLESGRDPRDFEEKLEKNERIRELLAINLRLLSGVDLLNFNIDKTTKKRVVELEGQGLITYSEDKIALTKQGVLFYDLVATKII